MAKALPYVLGAAAIVATGGAATPGVAAAIGISATTLSAVSVGLSVAGTLAGALLAEQPSKPKMADGDASIKQAIPPRTRLYGRQRLGGVFDFYDSNPSGDLNTLLHHASHLCDAVEEHWLNDERVELSGGDSGDVTSDPWDNHGNPVVTVVHYNGDPNQTVNTLPNPPWTVAHRARGLCLARVKYSDLKDEEQVKVFPSNAPPYRAVLRGARIYDPREAIALGGTQDIADETTWTWSDNSALVLLDYLTRFDAVDASVAATVKIPVGFGIDINTRIDLASFATAADASDDEIVTVNPPGVEPRWRSWGAYDLTEDRKSVLQDLLDACGGRLLQGPDGKIGLTVGAPNPVAGVTINDDQILQYDLSSGKAAIERINVVRATYVSQAWEWAETEAGIQQDQDAIDRNGEESSQVKLRFVPAESQAQRVAKSILKRGSPRWAGKVRGTLALLDAWGERWIRLQISELEIDQVFEITGMRVDRDTMTVEMDVTSYDGWWDWNAAVDEQEPAQVPPDTDADGGVPIPQNVTVTIEHRQINGNTLGAFAVVAWDPPPRSVYVGHVRYRPVTLPTASAWQLADAQQDELTLTVGPLKDGQAYEAQAKFTGPRGSPSDWSASVPFTAVADNVAPGVPTGLTAQIIAPPVVTLKATAPNSANFFSLKFYRNSSNTFVGASLIGTFYSAPNVEVTTTDSPGVGDWWYFATATNGSAIASSPTSGVLAEVAPAAPVITSPSGPITTYDTTPTISGTSTASASIKLFANAVQVGTGTANGSGNWTVTPSTPLGIGINNMTATQTVAGNESLASGLKAVTVNAIDADAWAYIDAMTVVPAFARQTLIATLVTALKAAGVWTLLDTMYLLAAHDAQAARLNLRNPATFALTATSSPVFTADSGYKGTGVGASAGGYLASSFVPSTAGGQWALNSAHLGVWNRTAASTSLSLTSAEIGVAGAYIYTKDAVANNIRTSLNDGTVSNTAASAPTGLGHFCTSRTAGTGYAKYHTGVAQAASGVTSTALPASAVSILRANSSSHSDAEVCAAHWGAGLTATQELDLYNALHAYLQGTGAVA